MATTSGRDLANLTLKDKLFEEAYVFDFLQAVRIFQSLYSHANSPADGTNPDKEAVRFKSTVSFAFPPSDLSAAYLVPAYSNVPILEVNFLGIAGNQGPLPTPYTQLVIDRIQKKDFAFRDFLDIFNNRLIALLYKIRKRHRLGICEIPLEETTVGQMLRAFTGLGFQNSFFQNKLDVPDRSLIGFAGFLWSSARSSIGLKKILERYFKTGIRIREFQGRWVRSEKNNYSLIGGATGQFNVLGENFVLGKMAWDKVGHITVSIGPMNLSYFCTFFPEKDAYKSVCDLITFYTKDAITFDLNLILEKEEVPPFLLGKESFLGWRTWTKTKPFLKNAQDVYIYPLKKDNFN